MCTVLNTPELLGLNFLQLPMRDLLLAQRVSRYFHEIISSTPALQEAVFFRAARAHLRSHSEEDVAKQDSSTQENLELSSLSPAKSSPFTINPLLYANFGLWFTVIPVVCGPPLNS